MFLIKSIFLIIVNKKPHFKKVPLIIFQFPSPPTLNNWLSRLLNLYSFVIYLYSSSIHFFFCVFSSSSSFSLFYFFSSHKATWSRRMVAAAHFGLFRWSFRLYRFLFPTESARINLFWPESTRIWPSLCESKKKKGESQRVGRRTPRRTPVRRPWSHVGAF